MTKQLAVILIFAFVIRVAEVFAGGFWSNPLQREPTEEVRIAQHIVAGHGFATPDVPVESSDLSPSAHSAPAYPFFLAMLIRVCGALSADPLLPYRMALLTGALVGAGAVGLLAISGRMAAGTAGFWIVGIIASLWPTLVMQSGVIWDTPFAMVTIASGTLFLVAPVRAWPIRKSWSIGLGALVGLAFLINPVVAPFLAGAMAVNLAGQARLRHSLLIIFFVASIVVAPWMIRNTVVFHRFIPIRNSFGLALWAGNQPGSDGTVRFAISVMPMGYLPEHELAIQMGEDPYMQLKSSQAIGLIRGNFGQFVQLTGRRILMYWFGVPSGQTVFFGIKIPMVLGFSLFKILVNGLLLVLGIISLVRWRPRWGRLVLGAGLLILPLPFYITHVGSNYRAWVDPLLCLLMGTFAAEAFGWLKRETEAVRKIAVLEPVG